MIRYAANDALAGLFCFGRILGHDREDERKVARKCSYVVAAMAS